MHINFYWVYDLPNWLFGFLSVMAFVLFGVAGLYPTRKSARRLHKTEHSHNDIVSYYLAAVTVLYGITLGLVAIGTWTTYSQVEASVGQEAETLGSLYRDIQSYGDPLRQTLQQDLRNYTRSVIDVSWPEQRQGRVSNASSEILKRFQDHFIAFNPATSGMQIVHAEAYKQFNKLIEMRRARLNSVSVGLPGSLWVIVILGALITIAMTWFFDTPSVAMHFCMTMMLSGLLGLMIYLVATLDNPFRGPVSVSSEPLEMVYVQTMQNK